MSAGYLLDANTLIALVVSEHEHHARATGWITTVDGVALCPITEGALARYLIRAGESAATVSQLLMALHQSPATEFWADSLSYSGAQLGHVIGHRQVTDAYLASLAATRDARLATFDRGLANTLPDDVVLIP